jgi:hypothetical protein
MRQPCGLRLMLLVQLMQRLQLGMRHREIDPCEDHQPGEGEEEVKRQRQHAHHVVQVQHAALHRLLGAESEELAEELAVHDHAGHQCHQHHQGRESDNPETQSLPVEGQAIVQGIEETAADLELVIRQSPAAAWVDGAVAPDPVIGILGIGHHIARKQAQHRVPVRGVSPQLRTVSKRSGMGPFTLSA